MAMASPQQFRAKLVNKDYLSEDKSYLQVKLELVEPAQIEFAAGQYASLKVNEQGERRSYSIASTPDEKGAVTLLVELIPEGKGSEYLKNLEVGAEVEILAPLGKFVVRGERNKLLFVASGSGIVPIRSMVRDLLLNKNEKRQMRLHWGMRNEEKMFWYEELAKLSEEHTNLVFDQVLSQASESWTRCRGHVQDCLREDLAKESFSEWEAYVCGSPTMVEDLRQFLVELGMENEHIFHEKFK